MSARPGTPSVIQKRGVGVRADTRVHESYCRSLDRWDARNGVFSDLAHIRHTPRDNIRTGLPHQILESARDEPGRSAGHAEPEPAGEPFPQLAAPDQALGDGFGDGGAGDEEERGEEDYGGGGAEGDDDDDGDGDGVGVVGVGELGVGEGDGAFVGGDGAEADADGCCSARGLGSAVTQEGARGDGR